MKEHRIRGIFFQNRVNSCVWMSDVKSLFYLNSVF